MKNIHLIPTDKPSRLLQCLEVIELLDKEWLSPIGNVNRNIYITNDEEIKDGDWCIDKHNVVYKQETDKIFTEFTGSKKIILTTDQDLINDGVQAIDDTFLEWFVKNPSCENVKTDLVPVNYFGCETIVNSYGFDKFIYKIIIPQEEPKQRDENGKPLTYWGGLEEPKQETLEEVECNNCGYLMSLTEDESVYACYNSECTSCYEEYEEEPKEETLEEAAKRAVKSGLFKDETLFIAGSKWQQEQDKNKYSEEEVKNLFSKYQYDFAQWVLRMEDDIFGRPMPTEWFEQFKKK
jgi:hypothetical protein